MLISVVVAVRNTESYIERCAAALVSQDYAADEVEIIMVDNGSTDGSVDLIRAHPRIRLLHEGTGGAYVARNAGLRAARGEVIAFTDPDCVPDAGWLGRIADAFSDPALQVLVGSYAPAAPSKALSALAAYENAKNRYVFSSRIPDLYYGYTNNMAARARLFGEFGPFLQRTRGSDAIFARRVMTTYGCDAVRYLDDMRVAHLEIDSIRSYYRKVFIHATSVRELTDISAMRPLGFRERLMVFRQMASREGHGAVTALTIFFVLTLGLACWVAGTVRGLWARSFRHLRPRPRPAVLRP